MNNDRYRYIKDLGKGGSGSTKLVFDRHLGIKKVIKEVTLNSPEQVDAFLRETSALKTVKHPGIPVITDQWIDRNTGFFVMDYCEGTSLDAYVHATHHLSAEQAVSILLELCQIIAFLHDSSPRIIHGDLKPENLILSPTGLRLLDFGTAYFENGCNRNSPALALTYGYASTALLSGANASIESDIYAIGMIFFFLLTRRDVREFPGKTLGIEDFPQEYSDDLKAIFSSCLQGYHHIAQLIDDLNDYLKKYSVSEAATISKDIHDRIHSNSISRFFSDLKAKLLNTSKRRDEYIRLEHIILTDGGHILFTLIIGLCIGLLFGMKYPAYDAKSLGSHAFISDISGSPNDSVDFETKSTTESTDVYTFIPSSENEKLPLSLQTKSGDNIILREDAVFEDSSFPSIRISDRKLQSEGQYSISVSVSSPEGKCYLRSFYYNKI